MSDNNQDVVTPTWLSPALRPSRPAAVGWRNAPKAPVATPVATPKPKLVGDARIAAKTLAGIEAIMAKRIR